MELRRIRSLATNSNYGECWASTLEQLDTHCAELTSESQGLLALKFTHCHLSSSGRNFPACPEGSVVSRCTASMDTVAFNTYTEFFTHAHAICHFLQSEAWHNRAENTMHRLTESSAGVVEQLQSTQQMAEELMEAQSVALQAQQEILESGEELRVTLRDATQGLRSMFSELSSVSKEQQVALSELFNRVSFMQNFLIMEAHSVTSCLYSAAALCASFLLTSTQRSSRARLPLMGLVCMNFYLERKIYQHVTSDYPEHKHMLQDTQRRLQEVLQRAESFGQWKAKDPQLEVKGRQKETKKARCEEERDMAFPSTDASDISHRSIIGWSTDHLRSAAVTTVTDTSVLPVVTPNAAVTPGRHPRRRSAFSSSSPLVYSILVEDKQVDQVQPRYSLRSRRSQNL